MIFAKIKLHLFITNLKRSKHKRRLDVDSYRRMQRDALFTTIIDLIGISISQPPALFIGPQPRPWPPDPVLYSASDIVKEFRHFSAYVKLCK